MLHANQESPSKRLLIVACCVLTSTICVQAASAETIFFDNFNDGDAGDGMPVTWVPGSGTWDASSGDYVATGSLPRVSRVLDHVLGDTSARAQVRVLGNLDAGIAVRRSMVNQGYAGVIRTDGSMAIARVDGLPVSLGSAVVPFNPEQQDVMLQFDAFGDKLSLWAWPVGDPMPDQPQIVVFDGTYAEGPAGLVSAGFAAVPSDTTIFRSILVANTHIPDPSTIVLIGDYNDNGLVEQGDLDLVLLNWGADATTPPDGWTNSFPTGAIDQKELDGVLLHWGEGSTIGASTAAIPEPSSILLVGLGLVAAFVLRIPTGQV